MWKKRQAVRVHIDVVIGMQLKVVSRDLRGHATHTVTCGKLD